MHTSGLFAELGPGERREVAAELELRRARGGTDLLMLGESADALFITITGHVEVREARSAQPRIEGAAHESRNERTAGLRLSGPQAGHRARASDEIGVAKYFRTNCV